MICNYKNLLYLIICILAGLCALNGCGPKNYKKDADERVYKIIDQKWKDEYGTKANYKISDTEPLPNDIQIEKAVPNSGILTLPQAVAIATAHNREYQTQKEELYIKALDSRLIRHNFERLYYGRPKRTYARLGGTEYTGVGAGVEPRFSPNRLAQDLPHRIFDTDWELDGDEIAITDGFGFDQMLTNGTKIGANIALAWGRILSGTLKGESLISVLSFEIARPLLRGSGRKVATEELTQAERDTLYQIRLFNRFRKTFVVSVISQYYLVLQQYDAVKNAQKNYNTLKWLYNKVEKLADAGRLPKLELEQIRQETLQALNIYILAEKEYKQALDEFKITLSIPTTTEFQLDVKELESLRTTEMTYPDFSETEAVETALTRRLDLANSYNAIADARRKVYVAEDSLRAQLDLGVNVNIPLQGLSSPNAKVFQDSLITGLQADLPFDRVAEQNIYRKALIALNQREREYELATDTVTLEIRQAYRDLKEAAQSYRVQVEGLKLAEKRLKNTFLLLQYGRASSRRFLNAQNDLFDAQNAAAEALVNYMVATLNFYRDTEVLQVRPDGMWEKGTDKKAPTAGSSPNTTGQPAPAINQKRLSLLDSFAPRVVKTEQ